MIFKQFYLKSLGHASYFIGSEDTGEALVLDLRRDVDDYLEEAQARGMRLRYSADSHQHNDYLSGICELPGRYLRGGLPVVGHGQSAEEGGSRTGVQCAGGGMTGWQSSGYAIEAA